MLSKSLAIQLARFQLRSEHGIWGPSDMDGDADGYAELVNETAAQIRKEKRKEVRQ